VIQEDDVLTHDSWRLCDDVIGRYYVIVLNDVFACDDARFLDDVWNVA
jgi:hypothetical protein